MIAKAKITLEGKEVTLHFGLPALRLWSEKTKGWGLYGDIVFNDVSVAQVLYSGYINECMIKQSLPEFKFEDFYNFLQEAYYDTALMKEIIEATDTFKASNVVKKSTVEVTDVDEEEKKSVLKPSNGTKSKHSVMANSG